MLWLYRTLQIFGLPLVALVFVIRCWKSKEHATRWPEKWGFYTQKRPVGNLVHLHAASVGEANSLLPLLSALVPYTNTLLTTGTLTSANLMAKMLPKIQEKTKTKYQLLHQFSPLDFYPTTRRFYRYWHPNLTIFTESEFWPELISGAKSPMLINARISDRSWPKYQRHQWFFKPLVQKFTHIFTQQQRDADRLKELGARHIHVGGNLKFDAAPLPVDEQAFRAFEAQRNNRPTLLFASTHSGEEEQALRLHQELKPKIPNLLIVIAPRHPQRGGEIRDKLSANAVIAQRSKNEKIEVKTDIYIADTMGELGLFYRAADVVIMGGSLIPHGGQNPLEPLRLGAKTLSGPHMFNFADMLPALSPIFHPAKSLDEVTGQVLNSFQKTQEKQQKERADRLDLMVKLSGPTQQAAERILTELNGTTT